MSFSRNHCKYVVAAEGRNVEGVQQWFLLWRESSNEGKVLLSASRKVRIRQLLLLVNSRYVWRGYVLSLVPSSNSDMWLEGEWKLPVMRLCWRLWESWGLSKLRELQGQTVNGIKVISIRFLNLQYIIKHLFKECLSHLPNWLLMRAISSVSSELQTEKRIRIVKIKFHTQNVSSGSNQNYWMTSDLG